MSIGLLLMIRIAGAVAGIIIGLLLLKLWNSKPCWLRGHRRKHLSIEIRVFPMGNCGRPVHNLHGSTENCYVTKWICEKCDEMGFWCVGSAKDGAWTIEHGKIVPDEKAWAQWNKWPNQ